MSPRIATLFRDAYPNITFLAPEEVVPEQYYATYYLGLFFDDPEFIWQPCDFRHVGLHRTAAYILGVDAADTPPRIVLPDLRLPSNCSPPPLFRLPG